MLAAWLAAGSAVGFIGRMGSLRGRPWGVGLLAAAVELAAPLLLSIYPSFSPFFRQSPCLALSHQLPPEGQKPSGQFGRAV